MASGPGISLNLGGTMATIAAMLPPITYTPI